MRTNNVKKYRRLLEDITARVGADADGMAEQSRAASGGNGGSELSNAPMHLADMGTDEYLYDMNTTLLANERYIVAEARAAIDRLDDGSFGICESCGAAIAVARLEAIPYTRFCVKCAASNDQTPQVNYNEGRPRSPQDTLAPEGEMDENRRPRVDPFEAPSHNSRHGDNHAAGTAGGGTAVGGLAGSNEGYGDPIVSEVDDATASGNFDVEDDRTDDRTPMSGFTGGAVGGTPARKRAK
jgi:RNA polymerase-binding transcription factor DksA